MRSQLWFSFASIEQKITLKRFDNASLHKKACSSVGWLFSEAEYGYLWRSKVIDWHRKQWYNKWRWSSRIWCTPAVLVFCFCQNFRFHFVVVYHHLEKPGFIQRSQGSFSRHFKRQKLIMKRFLDASSRFPKRVCPSVRPSVHMSTRDWFSFDSTQRM